MLALSKFQLTENHIKEEDTGLPIIFYYFIKTHIWEKFLTMWRYSGIYKQVVT